MISTITLSPEHDGLMAAGSYSRSICLYDASGGEPRMIRSLKSKHHDVGGSGVTQVKFHPTAPELLYTTSRCSKSILVWDVRNTNSVVLEHARKGNTNQRIQFDIDAAGKWLVTGDTVRRNSSAEILTGVADTLPASERDCTLLRYAGPRRQRGSPVVQACQW